MRFMKGPLASFALGVAATLVVIAILVWTFRFDIANKLSIGYEVVGKPVQLNADMRLFQDGQPVGVLRKGTVLRLDGRAKDSPMEYFSVQLMWENRGVKRGKVYQLATQSSGPDIEMRSPFDSQ